MKVRPSIILQKNQHILLLKYVYNSTTVYGIPGGNPDPYEALHKTIIRELKEELCLDVTPLELLASGEVIIEEKSNYTLHMVFSGILGDQEPKINPSETSASGFDWIPVQQLRNINLYPNIGMSLADILEKKGSAGVHLGKINQKWF